jgi:putative tryptophan/tyrosine transport system substrate-binding protein
MTRRTIGLFAVLVLGLLGAPLAATAQPPAKMHRIGVLGPGRAPSDPESVLNASWEAFLQGLRALGYLEGQNLTLEYRWAGEHLDRLPALATELVRLPVDLILVWTFAAALAAKHATTTIPILMVGTGDPLERGLVTSLARPGENITGIAATARPETSGKQLQLLKEAVPHLSRVAILWRPDLPGDEAGETGSGRAVAGAAKALGIALQPVPVRGPEDVNRALTAILQRQAQALMVVGVLPLLYGRQIAAFAAQHRLPTMYDGRWHVHAGGLMSYGPSDREFIRRAAAYVDKILKGAKPADLPVEQPTTLELVINLKTAQALGLTITPTLLFQADEVLR